MKKFILFLIFTFHYLLFTIHCSAQWEADIKLSTNEVSATLNENMGQCLAVSGDSIHVVWRDNLGKSSAIFYKHSFDGGNTWSADTRISTNPSYSDFPSISASGAVINVAFRDSLNSPKASYYVRSTDGGNTWSQPLSLGSYYWWPSITSSGSGVYMALNAQLPGNSEVYFRGSIDNGTNWDTVYRISNAVNRSEDPSISAFGNNVYLAWNDNRTGIMNTWYRASSDYGLTWGPETQRTNSTVFAYCPMIHARGADVNLVWGDRRTGAYEIFFKQSNDYGATWTSDLQLTHLGFNSVYPVIARDGSNIHIVWIEMNNGIGYIHSADGGLTWDPAVTLVSAANKPNSPFIVISGTAMHVIWADQRNGHSAIYYKRNLTCNTGSTYSINGAIQYDNSGYTPLDSVKLYLADSSNVIIDSTSTDANGKYVFSKLTNQTYYITAKTAKLWGGVNPLDALLINRTYIGLNKFNDELYSLAADVNIDSKINPVDALMVNRRYIKIINSFKQSDWIFEKTGIKIKDFDVYQNIKAVCTGDVNGSYIPK